MTDTTRPESPATPRPRALWPRRLLAGLLTLLVLAALVAWLNVRGEAPIDDTADAPFTATPQQIAQGAYIAHAGNCAACHTALGGADYAGGLGIATPFGTVYTSNLTPDADTGLGRWTPASFWRAMHHGRSFDGRLLYPAFPYTSYTEVSRADSDALFAYLQSLPAVAQARRPHALRFPYDTQWALALWRALYFRPGRFEAQPTQSEAWNRGAYLVQSLGHCNACHAERNALGAARSPLAVAGGLIPLQNWYAPPLGGQPAQPVATLLQHGVADGAVVYYAVCADWVQGIRVHERGGQRSVLQRRTQAERRAHEETAHPRSSEERAGVGGSPAGERSRDSDPGEERRARWRAEDEAKRKAEEVRRRIYVLGCVVSH